MRFHYAIEKRLFDRLWARKRKEYEAAGLSEQAIQELYCFDWEWFLSRRRYANHTQPLPAEQISGEMDEGQSSLVNKFSSLMTQLDESQIGGRYGWVESVEDRLLYDKLRRLSRSDLELLTLLVIEGYTQPQLAEHMGCSQANISKKLTRIKKFLK